MDLNLLRDFAMARLREAWVYVMWRFTLLKGEPIPENPKRGTRSSTRLFFSLLRLGTTGCGRGRCSSFLHIHLDGFFFPLTFPLEDFFNPHDRVSECSRIVVSSRGSPLYFEQRVQYRDLGKVRPKEGHFL